MSKQVRVKGHKLEYKVIDWRLCCGKCECGHSTPRYVGRLKDIKAAHDIHKLSVLAQQKEQSK